MIVKTQFDPGDKVEVMVRNVTKKECPCCGVSRTSSNGFIYKSGVIENLSFSYDEGRIEDEEYYIKLDSGKLAFSFPEGIRLLEEVQ